MKINSLDDLKDLPQELIDELSLSESDHAEFKIVNIIEKNGGTISIDHLLVALYKQNGVISKRRNLTAKLYRMKNKNLLCSDRCGNYSVVVESDQPSEEQQ